jgi:predicted lysophospholipase L1 biosynthesis ABC-type transport system permease subunit
MSDQRFTEDIRKPPSKNQLSPRKLLTMSFGSLRLHFVASVLQLATIAATGAFLTFVLGEIFLIRSAEAQGIKIAEGRLAHLIWILAISLLVCTISNITSMLLSVTKRFREIGTMKCLGAFDGSILVLFLMEAMILGGVGALAGALLGGLLTVLLGLVTYGSAVMTASVFGFILGAVGITFVVVVILSFIGAAYPAWKASRMLPVEAMRSN